MRRVLTFCCLAVCVLPSLAAAGADSCLANGLMSSMGIMAGLKTVGVTASGLALTAAVAMVLTMVFPPRH
jgi:hypothetical protein